MDAVARKAAIRFDSRALVGAADIVVGQHLAREIERIAGVGPVEVASSLLQLRLLSSHAAPAVILLDYELLDGAPLADSLRRLVEIAPVVLLAPPERQGEIARHVAGGGVEFVARVGDFAPLAAALIQRRLRWAEMSESILGPPWSELPGDLGSIFRHEINNPLTGILGNAELLLGHRERLASVDAQRLQTVVDLAVRRRETIRRLSNTWEARAPSAKSA